MDRTLILAHLSGDVRRIVVKLTDVSNALVELRYGELAAKCTHLELQLMDLQLELLNLSAEPARGPYRKQPTRRHDDGIPF